jgi:hypothetical protein
LPDLVCHFFTQPVDLAFGVTRGLLTGKTIWGTRMAGSDLVRIVGRKD